jgi:conjugative relaxase-like TrwC/TraI family protein
VMTVHKLSAGDGYTYLTRQVASADERLVQGQSLAEYYLARGNPPGVWLGAGAAQLGVAGSVVSEAQMRALFGEGRHPDRDAMLAAGAPEAATRLGAAYPTYAALGPYADRVAQAVGLFEAENGRPPSGTERNRIAAKEARRGRRAVAGYDLVFTPVKSASLLWALGGPEVRAQVEAAHHEALGSAMGWLEQHAAFTRAGHAGVAQLDATGLICAAFDHRESRSGDPDLHTHVAVANKVCGTDGKWRSLDARNLYALGVAASERYNTRFEDALARRLGVAFAERPGGTRGKRPVREIVGIPEQLIGHFSRRRAAIETRYDELRAGYRKAHGREPDRAAQLRLAQQATLETREGKGPGRTLAEQVTDWRGQAERVLGRRRLDQALAAATGHPAPGIGVDGLDDEQVEGLAREVVQAVAEQRSTWTVWNVHAETERRLRAYRFTDPATRDQVTESVVAHATGPGLSIRIAEPELVAEPAQLVRASDGTSVFVPHGSERYTASAVLLAEDRLVAAAQPTDPTNPAAPTAPHVDPLVLDAALAIHEAGCGVRLDPGQRQLVQAFATSPARVVVGIGPAGAGKTTAMRAFAQAWQADGGRVVPLATSSKAAEVLGAELGLRAENLHKFLHENNPPAGTGTGPTVADGWFRLRAGDVVLLDEAGMAGTLQLARLLDLATTAGATIRLLGDPAQLAAVDAGGALQLLEQEAGATYLTELHRFTDPAEGHATLALRAGDPAALGFYTDHGRIESGDRDAMLEQAYTGWATDVRTGLTSVLIAATADDVAGLNARARLERVAAGQVTPDGVLLADENTAGRGDWVVTRANARTLTYPNPSPRGPRAIRGHRTLGFGRTRQLRWVHNGDTWEVLATHADGSLTVRHREHRGQVRLPAGYVAESVELAYAATAHRVQGMTSDTAHALITPEMTREALYVASTRGRTGTRWYVATETALDIDCHTEPAAPATTDEVLNAVLARTGAETSATACLRDTQTTATSLPTLVGRYQHARDLAARAALPHALTGIDPALAARILADPGSTRLARALADVASRGGNPTTVLRHALDLTPTDDHGDRSDLGDLGDLAGVRSPAAVLASRIEDQPRTLGAPTGAPLDAPLAWLPGPHVGHPDWTAYLTERAHLIAHRASELETATAVYRELYTITDPDPTALGPEPEPGTRQHAAYRHAVHEQQQAAQRSGRPAQQSASQVAQEAVRPSVVPPRRAVPETAPPRSREPMGPRLTR